MYLSRKLLLLVFFFSSSLLYSQENFDVNLYNWFDTNFSKNNLDINNGLVYMDSYQTAKNSHQFYRDKKFSVGSVKFDNQVYYDLSLNYDIYKDLLLLKPNGNEDLRAINCIKSRIAFFTLANAKIVNLNYNNPNIPDFINGFYQEDIISTDLILYTKNKKDKTESITNTTIYSDFIKNDAFVFLYKNLYHQLDQNTTKTIFPELKNEIDAFFNENYKLNKSNKKQFSENLLIFINAKLNKI